ncbi:two-component system sensor kinase FixL [Sphingomonas sp. BE270]|jgi:two-component system sensor kinase FixL|uniref:PAS domain-containing sensor histidine kinase n=1 Tax=Sphingomonas sp. BE270 TaxID=2817726 RepID=UPI0028571F10|nr:PAS domain S-box protein [Sphingomonas sp. BE270]MDR7256438.1 two-component system sensor kinase FixL [Sphingomonas sp. BE270]
MTKTYSPLSPRAGPISSLAAAVIFVAIATVAALALEPLLADRPTWLLLTVAVLASAWASGVIAAGFATVASTITGFLLVETPFRDMDHLVHAAGFATISIGIILLTSRLSHWREAAHVHEIDAGENSRKAHETAEELALLIDGATSLAIYMLDEEGRVAIWNKGAERIKGWREEDILGRSASTFYPAEDIASGKPDEDLAFARKHGRFQEKSWRLRKDGSEFLADVTITSLFDEDGRLRGYGKVVRDITDEKAAERAIERREAQLNSILATVPDAMVVIDAEGTMLSFSHAAQRMFGYEEAEVLGRNVSMLMPSPDREAHDFYLARYLQTRQAHIIGSTRRVMGCRKDGTLVPHELAIGEATGGGERVFTGFMRDLTQQEATAAHLKDLQAELIHVSRVSAMGAMASTLAHELNQPITAVVNYVQIAHVLLEDPEPKTIAEVREALAEAASESLRAGQIVRRLRDFVARGEVQKQVEDLPKLIEEACSLGLVGLSEHGIQTRLDLDPSATPVLADRVQIEQVLVNLIRNAAEAMAESPVRELTISTALEGAAMVRVTIADTGPGLAEEVASQLFQAFLSTKTEGMGLGLSICRTIVEAHGGKIWVDTTPEGGTRFHFTLMHIVSEDRDDG